MSKCSVIIPVYNGEKYIKDCVMSACNQTVKDIEIIVIDDGSKDNTANIVAEMAQSDNRIKLLKNEVNLKVSKSRNRGIQESTSEWIALLDADDMWEPNKLEKQFEVADKHSAVLLFTGTEFIDDDGNRQNKIFKVKETVNYKELLKQNVITCSSVLIKKELLEKYPMYADEMHEDFVTWLKILKNEKINAYGINEPLVLYRLTPGSKSRNKFKAMKMTYKTYRHLKLNFFQAHWNLMFYIIRSLKKYS